MIKQSNPSSVESARINMNTLYQRKILNPNLTIIEYLQSFLEYVLIFLIIVSCNSVYIWSSNFEIDFNELIIWPLAILLIISFIDSNLENKMFKYSIYIVVFINIFQMWFVKLRYFDKDMIPYYTKYVLFISMMIIYLTNLKIQNKFSIIINRFVNVMVTLSIISILFWTFGSILHWIDSSGKVLLYWGGDRDINSYFNLYFETQTESFFGIKVVRNSGIFSEGPMHAVALLSTLIIQLFILNKRLDWRTAVLSTAIFSSMTTSGVAVLAIMIVLKIYVASHSKISKLFRSTRKKAVLIIAVTLLVIMAYLFLKNKYGTGSYNTRLDDYRAGLKAWKQSIIFGREFGNMDPIIQYMSDFRMSNTGYSNSIVLILVQGGLFYASFYLLPILMVVYRAFEQKIQSLIIAMLLFVALLTILIFHETYFAMFFLSMFWVICLSLSSHIQTANAKGDE